MALGLKPVDLGAYSSGLRLGSDGVWTAQQSFQVAYPTSGHHACFEVEESSFWFQHRNTCIAAVIDRFPPPGSGPIFDVGGGNGVVAAGLSARGWPVVLVEPGEVGCRNALARGLQDVVHGTFEGASFRDGALPAVGLFDVIEHIEDDVAFLRTVGSKLIPGGTIYATVPAYRWLWSIDDEEAGHARRYTKRSITDALQSAGFQLAYVSYFFSPLPLGILLLRTIPSLLRLLRTVSPDRTLREHKPGGLLQQALTSILRIEQRLIPHRRIPFGSSILVHARWSGSGDQPS